MNVIIEPLTKEISIFTLAEPLKKPILQKIIFNLYDFQMVHFRK